MASLALLMEKQKGAGVFFKTAEAKLMKSQFPPVPGDAVVFGSVLIPTLSTCLSPGNAKPEGSPVLAHEPAKVKQEDNRDVTRPSRPAVSPHFLPMGMLPAGLATFPFGAVAQPRGPQKRG